MSLILLIFVVEESRVVILLHVLLGRLVDVHIGHLSLSLLSCLLLLFLSLLLLLDRLELIEDVLIVEQSVGELIPEGVTLEESLDTALDDGHLQELVDRWSLGWVSLEHHSNQVGNCGREMSWQR